MTPTELITKKIAESRKREKHIMRGPWIITKKADKFVGYTIGPEAYTTIAEVRNGAEDEEYGGDKCEKANATFIASARQELPMWREAFALAVEALEDMEAEENIRCRKRLLESYLTSISKRLSKP